MYCGKHLIGHVIGYCLLITIVSCNGTITEYSYGVEKYLDSLDHYKYNVLLNGDGRSYGNLSTALLERPIAEILPYAIIMANKYNDQGAGYNIFQALQHLSMQSHNIPDPDVFMDEEHYYKLDYMDRKTKSMALKYLKVGAIEFEEAKRELDSILKYPDAPRYHDSKAEREVAKLIKNASNQHDSFLAFMYGSLYGNAESYVGLRNICHQEPPYAELFSFALLMANKYDYTLAYYDVYSELANIYARHAVKGTLDEKTASFALDYLRVAAERKLPIAVKVYDSINKVVSQ